MLAKTIRYPYSSYRAQVRRRETEPSYTRTLCGSIFQVAGKLCGKKTSKIKSIQGKHCSVSPVRTSKKPKCPLIGNLCDLPTVRDIQMSVTTRTASKLNEFLAQFSGVRLCWFVTHWPGLKYDLWITDCRLKVQMFLLTFFLDETCRIIYGGLNQIFSSCTSLEEQFSIIRSVYELWMKNVASSR